MKPAIIFDFDGTIADSMWVILSIGEELLDVQVTPEQIEEIRGLSAGQIIKHFRIPLIKVPKLLTHGRHIMKDRLHEVNVFDGMPALLDELHTGGYKLHIMSSNSAANVRTFLREHGLAEYFSSINGSVGLLTKAPALKKLIRKHDLSKDHVVYIGDEARDVEGAKKAHIPIISVGWGYNSPALLKSLKPDFFVSKPAEIAAAVKSLEV
jgi:phosphoglycolate phosphatase-like HAD superfamily hydrolase